jgi:hypothetical protein
MSTKYFTAAWVVLATLSLIESVNGMSQTLGWGLTLQSPIEFDYDKRSTTGWAPVYYIEWLILQLPLLLFTHVLLTRNTKRPSWMRLPSLVGMPDASESSFTQRTHKVTLVLLILALLYAGGHFFRQTITAGVYCTYDLKIKTWTPEITSWKQHLALRSYKDICYMDPKGKGVQFYPPYEGYIFLISYTAIFFTWAWFFRRLIRRTEGS